MNKTVQDIYLELLAAWGDTPLDEKEVKNILHNFIKDVVNTERKMRLNNSEV